MFSSLFLLISHFLNVVIISLLVYPSFNFFSNILNINNDKKHIVKCAFILSSLFKYTGLALKSVFNILNDFFNFPSIFIYFYNISAMSSSRVVQTA